MWGKIQEFFPIFYFHGKLSAAPHANACLKITLYRPHATIYGRSGSACGRRSASLRRLLNSMLTSAFSFWKFSLFIFLSAVWLFFAISVFALSLLIFIVFFGGLSLSPWVRLLFPVLPVFSVSVPLAASPLLPVVPSDPGSMGRAPFSV